MHSVSVGSMQGLRMITLFQDNAEGFIGSLCEENAVCIREVFIQGARDRGVKHAQRNVFGDDNNRLLTGNQPVNPQVCKLEHVIGYQRILRKINQRIDLSLTCINIILRFITGTGEILHGPVM
jgi:hypothetical protein